MPLSLRIYFNQINIAKLVADQGLIWNPVSQYLESIDYEFRT